MKSPNRSKKKNLIAGAGLALMIPSTFAGAANALSASDAKPQEYKGAVSAEEYSKSTYDIPVDYSSLDAIAKAPRRRVSRSPLVRLRLLPLLTMQTALRRLRKLRRMPLLRLSL